MEKSGKNLGGRVKSGVQLGGVTATTIPQWNSPWPVPASPEPALGPLC